MEMVLPIYEDAVVGHFYNDCVVAAAQAAWELELPCCPLSSGCSAVSMAAGASAVGRQPSPSMIVDDAPAVGMAARASVVWDVPVFARAHHC